MDTSVDDYEDLSNRAILDITSKIAAELEGVLRKRHLVEVAVAMSNVHTKADRAMEKISIKKARDIKSPSR